MTYRGQGMPINIGKAKNNFNKNKKLKYFNYNMYRHIAKNCKKLKKILESIINTNKQDILPKTAEQDRR